MGLEAWNLQNPELADDCSQSIWRMVCYTYFPRARIGCREGATTTYMRPCQSSCRNYIRACGVECCDESVQCVFSHQQELEGGVSQLQTGYAEHDGPSSLCTGAAYRAARAPGWLLWALVLAPAAYNSAPRSEARARGLPAAVGLVATLAAATASL